MDGKVYNLTYTKPFKTLAVLLAAKEKRNCKRHYATGNAKKPSNNPLAPP